MLFSTPGPILAQAERNTTTAVNDAWITTQIHAKFFADADIKGRNIDVDTSNGVVTLSGQVYSETERTEAVARARETDGVANVVDKLTLVPGGPPAAAAGRDTARTEWEKGKAQANAALDRVGEEISDGWLTTKIQSKFYLDDAVKGLDIDVSTEDGVVTLSGTVTSPMERMRAIELATRTEGVKKVVDRLAMK
jgi:osmotically-inducible protein OsmY